MVKTQDVVSQRKRQEIIWAVRKYCYFDAVKVSDIAYDFNKSENEISNWFLNAIAKSYISSNDMCIKLEEKHIAEYEKKHHISNSSLRQMYNEAFRKRNNL